MKSINYEAMEFAGHKMVEEVVCNLVKKMGLSDSEPDLLEEMKQQLISELEAYLSGAFMRALSPRKLEELYILLDSGASPGEFLFLTNNIANPAGLLKFTIEKFQSSYLG